MCSRSLRLEPSALLADVTGPNKRLLNSFGVSGEILVLELNESSPKGEWDSLLSTDLSDPDSARQISTSEEGKKKQQKKRKKMVKFKLSQSTLELSALVLNRILTKSCGKGISSLQQ